MAKIENVSNSNFRIHNEGKNLINKIPNEIYDSSNYNDKTKNMTNFHINDKNFGYGINIKDKNVLSSKELKSELKKINNNRSITKTIQNKNALSSSFVYYKENKCVSSFKKIYGAKQQYISIILLIYSFILFSLSVYDLYKIINNNKGQYLLCNLIIFICELTCSAIVVLFHVTYYFINIGYNNIVFLIMSIIILIFSLMYVYTYIKQNVKLMEIVFQVVFNFLLIMINLIYLLVSHNIVKKNNKMQQNIEDIMNFSLRNEKMPDFREKGKDKDPKSKPVVLVEEENQNNNS
jgi:magnesium-transporting ATPase (P-type)